MAKKTTKKTTKKSAKTMEGKKKATKKATKKASPKKAAKPSSGLTPREVKVLKALKSGRELNRVELAKATGSKGSWAQLLGAATRDGMGVQGGGMASKGLITVNQYEGSRVLTYQVTPKGKAALQKVG